MHVHQKVYVSCQIPIQVKDKWMSLEVTDFQLRFNQNKLCLQKLVHEYKDVIFYDFHSKPFVTQITDEQKTLWYTRSRPGWRQSNDHKQGDKRQSDRNNPLSNFPYLLYRFESTWSNIPKKTTYVRNLNPTAIIITRSMIYSK